MKLKNRVHPGEIIKDEFVIPIALDVTSLAQELGIPLHVTSVRRMKKQGILDLLDEVDRSAEPD